MILGITQDNLCRVLATTKVEKLLSYCQKYFSCVLQVYRKFTKYLTYIYTDMHYRNQCDKMINNIKQGIFIF